ncbi:MAG TPA: ester cyclase [Dehalococcoidia bacterium]|nr:ester cyclase [Dehalococcoidia bacterium]
MSVEENKANIRRHVDEIWHKGNMKAVDELIHPNWVVRIPEGNDITGIDGFKQMAISQRTSFPDIHFTIDNMIGEGDYVAVQYTSTGTFKNKMGDIEPTGKKYKQPIVIIYRFEAGKQVETWISYNQLSMNQQLGIPIPGQ